LAGLGFEDFDIDLDIDVDIEDGLDIDIDDLDQVIAGLEDTKDPLEL